MNCSGSRVSLLQLAAVGFAGALLAAGCGGSGTGPKKDGGLDGPRDGLPVVSLRIAPTTQDFGSVAVGAMSAMPVTFTVTNAGSAATGAPSVSSSSPDFVATGCTAAIAAGGMCTIQVNFRPTVAGARTGTLNVTATPGGSQTAMLTGTGTTGGLTISPMTRDFGNVGVGDTSPPQAFTVTNSGMTALANVMVNLNGGDFVNVTPMTAPTRCGAMLAAGATCVVDLSFKPVATGAKVGSLVVGAGPTTATAALSGNGQTAPSLTIFEMDYAFNGSVGTTSPSHTFTVTNPGEATTGMLTAALTGPNMAEFMITANTCNAPIGGATRTCTVAVAFRPTSAAAKMASLTVTGTPGGTATARLTGAASSLGIDPTEFDYMTVNRGSNAVRAFTIRNNGMVATSMLAATVTATEFAITSNTCQGTMVAPMATCAVSVTFSPTSTGMKSAILRVTGTGGETVAANLRGLGAATGFTITPMTVDFASIGIGNSADRMVTVTNIGSNTSAVPMATLGGANLNQFTVATNNCTAALQAAGTCTILLRFTPTTAGDKSATLTVTGNAGESATANLGGSGLIGAITFMGPMAFPVTLVGQTSTATYIVANSGMVDTGAVTITYGGPNAAEFTTMGNNCTTLAPAVQCTVTVLFTPTSGGDKNASLVVTGAAGPSGQRALTATAFSALALAPATLDFGTQTVGTMSTPPRTFKLTVRGTSATLMAAVTGEFTTPALVPDCNSAGVVPGNPATWLDDHDIAHAACTVSVVFSPVNPRGAKMGTLTVTGAGGISATASVTGTAGGPLTIDQPADFGTVTPGMAGIPVAITVHNRGNVGATAVVANLTGGDVGDFQITANQCTTAGTIAAAGTCTVTISFQPTSNGPKNATLTVTATEATLSETASVNITGTGGMGPVVPTISLSPSPASVGNVPMSATGTVAITFTNPTGSAGPTGAITPPTSSSGLFTIAANTCGVGGGIALLPGQSCTFNVIFSPTSANGVGVRTSTISVITANLGTPTVTVSGTSIQPITITPAVGDFATGVVADTTNGPTVDFTVTNTGAAFTGATFTVLPGTGINPSAASFTRVNAGVVNNCTGTIPAGSCVVRYRFVAGSDGLETALLELVDADTRRATAILSGTGVTDAQLVWSNVSASQTREFGGMVVNTPADPNAAQTIELRNVGGFPTSMMAVATGAFAPAGVTAANFPLGGTCVGMTTLAPETFCTVVVNFAPGAVVGSQTANIVVTAIGRLLTSVAPAAVISLHGTGIPANGVTSLFVDPPSADLDETPPATTSPTTQTFTFHNTSGVGVVITNVTTTNPVYVVDTTAGGSCTAALPVGGVNGTCTFLVRFSPPALTPSGLIPAEVVVNLVGGATARAGLIGRVERAGALDVTTRPAGDGDFGEILINSMPPFPTRTWTLTNNGDAATGPITIGATNTTSFTTSGTCASAAGIAPGGTCTVVISAHPTMFAPPDNVVTIAGAGLEDNPTAVVSASVVGTIAAALTADALDDYGDVALGNDTPDTIVLHNNAANGQTTGPLGISVDNTDWTVTGCDDERASGIPANNGACTLTITVKPTHVGADNGTLTITASPPGGTPLSIPLRANGVPSITINDGTGAAAAITHHFAVGSADVAFTLSLRPPTNTVATGPLHVSITGTDAALFVKTTDNCSLASLTAGAATCTVSIRYTGTTGTRSASLTVNGSAAGNAAVATLASP
jgi:hypothetical protein